MTGAVDGITLFADALRERGMTVTPDQVADMTQSLLMVDPAREEQVFAAFRCLAITDPAHREPFEEEFRRFFHGMWVDPITWAHDTQEELTFAVAPILDAPSEPGIDETTTKTGASATENLASRDFADMDDDQLAEARRLVMTMLWQPTDFKTRRWIHDTLGRRPDMRRTLRGAVGPEGDLLRIERRRRRTRQRPLIIIADISGSMERYADLFMIFAHAAHHRLRHVEVFTFSTDLTRVTEEMSRRDIKTALARVTNTVTDWSGGTKIGEALAEWNRHWSRRLARGGPVVLLLSDGWDCGDPTLLSTEVARLSRSVHRLFWLNPLAGRAGYEPATRGARAILPYTDHLLPAASVNDLKGVVRLLETMNRM